MNNFWKIIFIFMLVCIFISACVNFIPIKKYQQSFFNIVKESKNKPQQHYDKQIEYVNYIDQHGELPPELKRTKLINNKIITKPEPVKIDEPKNDSLKPKYIRDKDNPNILHPYNERKFLFVRFY